MKRQGFTTVPLLAFNDSINNGKEISFSLQLDLIDVSKVSIISDTSKFLSVFFTFFGKTSAQIGFSLPQNRIIYLFFMQESSTFADENNK